MISINKILLVEDDMALGNGIILALNENFISIKQCVNLSDAKSCLEEIKIDLIILDVNLPDGNGVEFLKYVNLKYPLIKVIILTVNDMETDIVKGLEAGANDYITKPFSLDIFRARVKNQLRKGIDGNNFNHTSCYMTDDILFDFNNMKFLKANKNIELNKTEQKLLYLLIKNKGITLERNLLIDKVWTDDIEFVEENALSVTISRLRTKLEDNSSKPKYIKTIYGIGYCWIEE